MLRTRRPSTVSLSPPKAQKAKVSGELPVYSVFIEHHRSDESETSSSSSIEDSVEQAFCNKIQESFPLCRKNPHKEIAERRRRWMLRTFLAIIALILVLRNFSFPIRTKRVGTNNNPNIPQSEAVTSGRQLTSETENARSLDSLISQSKIRQEAETKLLQAFGEGPFLVEFELRVWGDDNRPTKYFFTMELAPTYLMPTAVYYFLQQVDNNLWKDTSIYLNTGHIIVTQLVSGNRLISKEEEFKSSGFGALPFREYSDGYPHLPYTIGLVGQGPAFFINKQYNYHHHDPCLGNIVIGRSTIDMISKMSSNDAAFPSQIRPIDIVATRRLRLQDLNDSALAQYAANSRLRQPQQGL